MARIGRETRRVARRDEDPVREEKELLEIQGEDKELSLAKLAHAAMASIKEKTKGVGICRERVVRL